MKNMMKNSQIVKIGIVSLFLFLLVLSTSLLPTVAAASANVQHTDHDTHDVFVAKLGAAPGVSTKASGLAVFWMTDGGTKLHYVLIVQNIRNVFMAHIHFSDGSIILWLYPNPNLVGAAGQTNCLNVLLNHAKPSTCKGYIRGEFNGVLAQGTISAANLRASDCAGCNGFTFNKMISEMEAGNTFVNIHTVQNPAGEIQGTITES